MRACASTRWLFALWWLVSPGSFLTAWLCTPAPCLDRYLETFLEPSVAPLRSQSWFYFPLRYVKIKSFRRLTCQPFVLWDPVCWKWQAYSVCWGCHSEVMWTALFLPLLPYAACVLACHPNAWSKSVRISRVKGVSHSVYRLYCPVSFLKLQLFRHLSPRFTARNPVKRSFYLLSKFCKDT